MLEIKNSEPNHSQAHIRVAVVGLSLVFCLTVASLLTLFGFALLDSIAGYAFGPLRMLLLAIILMIQNFGMMVLVGYLIARISH